MVRTVNLDDIVQEKNRRVKIYSIAQSIVVVLFGITMFYVLFVVKENQSVWLLTSLGTYFCIIILTLPLCFRFLSYVQVGNVIDLSRKIKELMKERLALLKKMAKENKIALEDMNLNFNFDEKIFKPVIKKEVFDFEDKVCSKLDKNKELFTEEQLSIINNHQQIIRKNLIFYLQSAIGFYNGYDKNIASGNYKEPLIPPMFFTEKDVAFFVKKQNEYNISEKGEL